MYTYTLTIPNKKHFPELKKQIETIGGSIEEYTKDEAPYDPEFVAKIRRAEKQPSVKVDIDNLWK